MNQILLNILLRKVKEEKVKIEDVKDTAYKVAVQNLLNESAASGDE